MSQAEFKINISPELDKNKFNELAAAIKKISTDEIKIKTAINESQFNKVLDKLQKNLLKVTEVEIYPIFDINKFSNSLKDVKAILREQAVEVNIIPKFDKLKQPTKQIDAEIIGVVQGAKKLKEEVDAAAKTFEDFGKNPFADRIKASIEQIPVYKFEEITK
jgi:hypothetical protein